MGESRGITKHQRISYEYVGRRLDRRLPNLWRSRACQALQLELYCLMSCHLTLFNFCDLATFHRFLFAVAALPLGHIFCGDSAAELPLV